ARSLVRERPSDVRSRHDFVAGWLTHGVATRWIHNQPGAPDRWVCIARCFQLITYESVSRTVRTVVRIGWPGRIGDGVDLVDRITRPVDVHIEAEIEVMLM